MKHRAGQSFLDIAEIYQALAYGYFEALSRTGDAGRIQSEMVRLKSLNNLLNAMGHNPTIYEDFVDETLNLLERTRVEGGAMLLPSFNDSGTAAAIITHFRVSLPLSISQIRGLDGET